MHMHRISTAVAFGKNKICITKPIKRLPRGSSRIAGERGSMKEPFIEKDPELLNIARILRRNMTKQEKHLWYDFLRKYPVKIYKQRIIENYVADFYCHKARLVIELDGSQHYTPEAQAYDKERSEAFSKYGILVLRFLNRNIDENFDGVCYTIDKTVKERMNAN